MKTFLYKAVCCICLGLTIVKLSAANSDNILSAEICYNGIDDNGDSLIDSADPLCETIEVTTSVDLQDGDISSVINLMNNPGPDGAISLREAIAAAQSLANSDLFYTIGFNLPNYDQGHFYYQDDGVANQVTAANKVRTTSIDDSTIDDKEVDFPHSWFQFTINATLPPLSHNILIDGYDLRQSQANQNEFGGNLNTIIRTEIVANGAFPIFTINEAAEIGQQVILSGLSLHGPTEVIQINGGTKGNVWLYGNYIGMDPTALFQKVAQNNLIEIHDSNRPVIIGSNKDGQNDLEEINLFAGTKSGQATIFLENTEQVVIRQNYFGVGLKSTNDLNGNEGTAIKSETGRNNNFDQNIISFYERGIDLYQSIGDSIQRNQLGLHSADNTNLVISDFGGISNRCEGLVITNNTIANSETGWRFLETTNSHFTKNEVFGHLTVGLSIVDEAILGTRKNEANFIFQNNIHDNLIGILLGLDATNNALIQNSIYANSTVGIDLSAAETNADGVSSNDLNDTDTGPNGLLNFPIIEVINYTVLTATVQVDLDIEDNIVNQEGYRIEFFANSSTTDRGGEVYIGYLDVLGDVSNAEVTLNLPAAVTSAYYISATTSIIKDASFVNLVPQVAFWATSEFSEAVPMPVAEICDNGEDDDGDGLIDCEDPDCANYTHAGTIVGEESSCHIFFDPSQIENEVTPFEDSRATVFYQWQKSINAGLDWENILGATAVTHLPSGIEQTTQYRRLVKKHVCNDWLVSNIIEKQINVVGTAEIIMTPVGRIWCAEQLYTFNAADAGAGAFYNWEFGDSAIPQVAVGRGPHNVTFSGGGGNRVILDIQQNGCSKTVFIGQNIHPILTINNVSMTQPSTCGGTDGSITVDVTGQRGSCISMSIDGGMTYLPDNQFTVNGLARGAYPLMIRYCEEGCPINGGIINLSDPTSMKANDDEISGYCPGVLFQGTVASNDTLGDNPVFSLAADANSGRITLENDGKFTYTPIVNSCGLDQFSYQVCNGNTGCCATAVVNITFGDEEAPTFGDLPMDMTIGIDDEIPAAAEVTVFDNCPAAMLNFDEQSSKINKDCGQYDYTITRTWTATDPCGNTTSHAQTIRVVDETAPDIFSIHTLPNGTKMVAGVMEFTSQQWKTIHLPYNFADNPIIFTQITTNNEATAATVQLRNVTQNQFQIRLLEAEIDDGFHEKESVSWMAMETGTQTADFQFQADTASVTHGWSTISFFQSFANIPLFFANMQTSRDLDAGTIRNNGVNWNNGKMRIQEENSADPNLAHIAEAVGYLAIDNIGDLTNQSGVTIGETGRKKVTHEWTTIPLNNTYSNPVVIANSLSIDDFDPATVRIQNVTATSFEISIKEWTYLDGLHNAETVGYLVIEGSLSLEKPANFCEGNSNSIQFGGFNEIVALDNTGTFLPISYDERLGFTGTEQLIHRDWSATDVCDNKGAATQIIACEGIALQAKTMLQGALLGSDNPMLMRDDLRRLGLIPTIEPYSELANFEHIGASGGEAIKDGLLEIEGADAIVDWVLLELRNRLNKKQVVATAVGLVQRDGDIISNKGDSLIVFPSAPQNQYYVSVRHRNHICMLSNATYEFSTDNVPLLDFKKEATTGILRGTMVEDMNAMWSGDLNQDNEIIYQGPNNDIFTLLLSVLVDPANTNAITNFVSKTYSVGDYNLDGKVIFQGPDNDRSALLFNTILIHPDNTDYFSNYILSIEGKGGE